MSTVKRVRNDAYVERLDALLAKLPTLDFPKLEVVTVKDDGETHKALRCPRCGLLADEADLMAVDNSLRWNIAGNFDDERGLVTFYTSDTEYDSTLFYMHGDTPGHAVSLPDGWQEDWS